MYSHTPGYRFTDYITEFDYDAVKIGDEDHYLPVRAREYVRRGKSLARNAHAFTGYRKYAVATAIVE